MMQYKASFFFRLPFLYSLRPFSRERT